MRAAGECKESVFFLFTSMKVSGVGWAQGEDVGSNAERLPLRAAVRTVFFFSYEEEQVLSV